MIGKARKVDFRKAINQTTLQVHGIDWQEILFFVIGGFLILLIFYSIWTNLLIVKIAATIIFLIYVTFKLIDVMI